MLGRGALPQVTCFTCFWPDGPREPGCPPLKGSPGRPLPSLRVLLCPSGRQLLQPIRQNLLRAEKVKWAHLPFLFLFSGVAVCSQNESWGCGWSLSADSFALSARAAWSSVSWAPMALGCCQHPLACLGVGRPRCSDPRTPAFRDPGEALLDPVVPSIYKWGN